jgi:hypothetical protein
MPETTADGEKVQCVHERIHAVLHETLDER